MPRDIDEQVVRGRRDPRREESIPPEKRSNRPRDTGESAAESAASTSVPEGAALEPASPPEPEIGPDLALEPEAPPSARLSVKERAADAAPATPRGQVVTNADPRLELLEPLLRAGDWDGVLAALGPAEQAGRLPPNLGLLYALARKEKEKGDEKGSDANEIAIRCTAALLGVAPDSAVALVVAKRLLRRNPVSWQKAPAPPAKVSAAIMIVALLIGGAIGWLVAGGYIRLP